MKIPVSEFSVALIAAMLAGCNGGGATTPPLSGGFEAVQGARGYHHSIQELNRLVAMTNAQGKGIPAVRHPIAHSWRHAAPTGTTGTLWADDVEYGTVDMIAYPSGTLIGQVSGFSFSYGNCSDKSGNVYVADFDAGELIEINSSGSVINSFPTASYPVGCSVAPNGDVAVTSFNPGDVRIVAGPDHGQDWGGIALDWPGGFDLKGNFYVECADESPCSSPSLYEWPAGGSSWMKLNFNHSIGFPGAVQNMGKHIGVADQAASGFDMGIYLTSVSGSTATSKKSIILRGEGSGEYVDDASSWGSINKKPNGVFAKSVKNIAAPAGNAINIYKKTGGSPIFQIVLGNYQYDGGVTFTRP